MKALVLTGPASQGQHCVAQALKAALAVRGAYCLVVSARALLGQHASLSMTGALENEALHLPRAFSFLSSGGTFCHAGKRKSLVYSVNALYAENLKTLLNEGEFDAILCTHRYPAEAISHIRTFLARSTRCCFVSTDYACIPFLEETALDLYFTAHTDLTELYCKRGISIDRMIPVGIPVPDAWFRAEEQSDVRTLLDLPQNIPCYLISSAGDATIVVKKLLDRLKNANARICVLAVENPALQSQLATRFGGDVRVLVVSSTELVPLYRIACNVLLANAVGILCATVAIQGIPLVHLPPLDETEAQNTRFFAGCGMAVSSESEDEAAELAIALLKDANWRACMIGAQQTHCFSEAAASIISCLFEGRPSAISN